MGSGIGMIGSNAARNPSANSPTARTAKRGRAASREKARSVDSKKRDANAGQNSAASTETRTKMHSIKSMWGRNSLKIAFDPFQNSNIERPWVKTWYSLKMQIPRPQAELSSMACLRLAAHREMETIYLSDITKGFPPISPGHNLPRCKSLHKR